MSYTKTVWRNNQAPAINADNLNHIEQGIESAHNQMAINTSDIETLTTQVQGNASNIASEISARQSGDSSLQSQIDQIIAPSGEAPSAAEVENARIGAEVLGNVTYDTLGNAIRGQVTDLKSAITQLQNTSVEYDSVFFTEEVKNLFDPSRIIAGKMLGKSNGKARLEQNEYTSGYGTVILDLREFSANDLSNITVSLQTAVSPAKIYSLFSVDADYNILTEKYAVNVSIPYTFENINLTGARYILFDFRYWSEMVSQNAKVMVNAGTTALPYEDFVSPRHYQPYKNPITDELDEKVAELESRVYLEPTDVFSFVKVNNLFNKDTAIIGKYLNKSGNKAIIEENEYTASYAVGIIRIRDFPKNDLENLYFSLSNGGANRIYSLFTVDDDYNIIDDRFAINLLVAGGVENLNLEGATYILFDVQGYGDIIRYGAHLMVNEGTSALPYQPFVYPMHYLPYLYGDGNLSLLQLPDSYSLVVGDTFQLFYKGIINAVNPKLYDVVANCAQGKAFERFFEITPTTSGTLTLNFKVYDSNRILVDTKDVSLIVSAKATSPITQKNVLCVGDSLTVDGYWPKEMYRRLTASDGSPIGDGLSNINFIGTRVNGGVHFEGYGGWTFVSYNTENVSDNSKIITCSHDKTAEDQHSIYQASNGSTWKLETVESGQIKIMWVSGNPSTFPLTGTLTWVSGGVNHSNIVYTASANAPGNPFWNENTNAVDFANYASEQGVSSIDYVYVLLGWNTVASTDETLKEIAQTFIDNVHADFPNAKIVLMGLEIPSRDGLAVNYGASGIYTNYYGLMQYVHKLDRIYAELADENTNVYSVNVSGQFDTEYNMQTGTRQVNTRNSETETYQINGVHPAYTGYMQIADVAYRDITARL